MQYMLTTEEYENLLEGAISKKEVKKRDKALAKCFELLQPQNCGETYCDECPIKNIGRKSWDAPLSEHLLCKKSQSYSK